MPLSTFNSMSVTALVAVSSLSSPCHATPLPRASSSNYSLVADYSGISFFDNFDTYTGVDPTDGLVRYVDMQSAAASEYVGFIYNLTTNVTTAYIGVQKGNLSSTSTGRGSVRLSSTQTFDVGTMVVLDVLHAPVAYGTWPAAWMLGSVGEWPASGEIDIMEWVHESPYNSMTLHTAPGCSVDNSTSAFQGTLLETNCNADNGSDGCSIPAYAQDQLQSSSSTLLATAGTAFNTQGGGVYVMDWQTSGITIWLFSHASVPADLAAGAPAPSTWTQEPLAQFAGAGCDFATAFQAQRFIFDITFCGSWAGSPAVWDADAANQTGVATCDAYVLDPGSADAFDEAYFEVASMHFYSTNSTMTTTGGSGQERKRRSPSHGVDWKRVTLPASR